MKYLVGIPYVNRLDLLSKAINSIKPFWPNTIIIDNSKNQDLNGHTLSSNVEVFEPPVPLSYSQSMNLLFKLGAERNCDFVMYMHPDGEAREGVPEALLSFVDSIKNEGRKWGVVYTNYDVLAAYNMEAIKELGEFDTVFPAYFVDNDYYYRMDVAGFERIDTGFQVDHVGSSTINSDPYLKFVNGVTFPLYWEYFKAKWGGDPGNEKYVKPFNKKF